MISHKHKCVFIHIPKCGGQSIEDAFIKENGLTWESREPLLLRRNNNPLVGPLWLAHLTYSEYLKYAYLTQDMMDRYYTFAVVRNPLSRLESIYKYLGYDCAISFPKFIKKVVTSQTRSGAGRYYFFRPQMDFLCDDDGEVQVDDIYHLEKLNEYQNVIIETAGLSVDSFSHVNKSLPRDFWGRSKKRFKHFCDGIFDLNFDNAIVWDEECLEIVNNIYEKDFSGLGYSWKSERK